MKYIKKVLVAVDLSENTMSQMNAVAPILEQLGCDMILLHCIPSLHQLPSEYMPHENIAIFMEETISTIRVQLEDLYEKYLSNVNVIIETPVGEPITLINEYATRYGCSMIIIGKSCKNSFERFFLGSVASKLLSSSSLPILLLG